MEHVHLDLCCRTEIATCSPYEARAHRTRNGRAKVRLKSKPHHGRRRRNNKHGVPVSSHRVGVCTGTGN